jgi:hypothetical protein
MPFWLGMLTDPYLFWASDLPRLQRKRINVHLLDCPMELRRRLPRRAAVQLTVVRRMWRWGRPVSVPHHRFRVW